MSGNPPCITPSEVDDDTEMSSEGEEPVCRVDLYGHYMTDSQSSTELFDDEDPVEYIGGSPDKIQLLKKEIKYLQRALRRELKRRYGDHQVTIQLVRDENKELEAKIAQRMKTSSSSSVETNRSSSNKNSIYAVVAGAGAITLLGAARWYKHRHQ